jgi:hypothetical protein
MRPEVTELNGVAYLDRRRRRMPEGASGPEKVYSTPVSSVPVNGLNGGRLRRIAPPTGCW